MKIMKMSIQFHRASAVIDYIIFSPVEPPTVAHARGPRRFSVAGGSVNCLCPIWNIYRLLSTESPTLL